ncbi:MAG: hypothetical protein MZV49_03505 [Rhodopseudomonas palustris]|nr:hypothetical protein [Rhodopseudomonas palustris]
MFGQKDQALADIAAIGFQRLGRQPALGAQMAEPARDLDGEIIAGAGQFECGEGSLWGFGHARPQCGAERPITSYHIRLRYLIMKRVYARLCHHHVMAGRRPGHPRLRSFRST